MAAVWWLRLSMEAEEMVKTYFLCSEHTVNRCEPLLRIKRTSRPWETVVSNLFELNGKQYLVVADYFSRWIEVAPLRSTTAASLINHIKSLPKVFIADNGPLYKSSEFARFMNQFSITHVTSSPRYPQSNGKSERAVQTVKAMFRKATDPYLSMLAYSSTPLRNGIRPSELMLGAKLRNSLPVIPTEIVPKWPDFELVKKCDETDQMRQIDRYNHRHRAQALSELAKGTAVAIKDNHWRSRGEVKNHADTPRSYLVETPQRVFRRNRHMLVVLPEDDNVPRTSMNANDTDAHNESRIAQEPDCSRVPDPSNVTTTGYGQTSLPLRRLTNY